MKIAKDITPISLFIALLQDLEELTDVSLHRDLETILSRYDHEGLPFLTQTLPSFGDYFFMSLKDGAIQLPPSFRRKAALPVFLIGLTSRVFDVNTGRILQDPCYIAAYAIRQICYLLYKYEIAPTPKKIALAYRDVIEVDRLLDESVIIDPSDKVFLIAESILHDIFNEVDWDDIRPKLGPGSTNMGRLHPWEKYDHLKSYDPTYDEDNFVACPTLISVDQIDYVTDRHLFEKSEMQRMRESKVSAVPKNSKGPRVISAEHPTLIWLQLGLADRIIRTLEENHLSRGQINFHDQSVNAKLALEGSRTGALATLDMSKASDRVSLKLCSQLLPVRMFRRLELVRSIHTRFPNVEVIDSSGVKHLEFARTTIELHKMAPMGNGYCFPLESLVFWALASASIAVCMEGVITSERAIQRACRLTHTYGDDLIVPSKYAEQVMADLERYGFKFNLEKSYWTGPFRESCGTDAFLGADITPLKVKKVIPRQIGDVDSIIGWLEMAKKWSILLPKLSALLRQTAMDVIGSSPIFPEGWEGCIGTPKTYDALKGREVKAGEILRRGKVKWRIPGSAVLETPHQLAPSDGKIVKVLRVETPRQYPDEKSYPELHRYLRTLCQTSAPINKLAAVFQTVEDTRSFTERNLVTLRYKKEFVS